MFQAKTVFILGAGASRHYGYPTGEELVQRVRTKASSASIYFDEAMNNPQALSIRPDYVKRNFADTPPDGIAGLKAQLHLAWNDCRELADKLRYVDPLVIDYFIGHNRTLEDIAKLCIAWAILESEAAEDTIRGRFHDDPRDDKNNWCRFIIHKLVTGCAEGADLLKNNVTFISFNYDTTLEKYLWIGLASLEQFEKVADEFLSGDRILHVYGKIRENVRETPLKVNWNLAGATTLEKARHDRLSPIWNDGKTLLDTAFAASQGIRTISPDKAETSPDIEKARRAVADAECVYILGYGFDSINNKMLDLPASLRASSNDWKSVLFTNYLNRGIVNKNASRMFFDGSANALLEERNQLLNVSTFSCEKSIGSVYAALAYDFDTPEGWPHS